MIVIIEFVFTFGSVTGTVVVAKEQQLNNLCSVIYPIFSNTISVIVDHDQHPPYVTVMSC